MDRGCFIVSLDFELFWGILDSVEYEANINRIDLTRTIILDLIKIFEENKIKVTWSTVGLLMLKNKNEMENLEKDIKMPSYYDLKYNNYINFKNLNSQNLINENVFFANEITTKLNSTIYQTIGTHTFSHYYCLESGQTEEEFSADLRLVKHIAKRNNIEIKSIVFPRNQYSNKYLKMLNEYDIHIFRGNPNHFIYKPRKKSNLLIRALRLMDTYLNIVGKIVHPHISSKEEQFNVTASRFLRPLNNTNKFLRKLQLIRIKNEMTHAAKNNMFYHLWWHPHNFSKSPDENIEMLLGIIQHFKQLQKTYNFSSESMESYVEQVKDNE